MKEVSKEHNLYPRLRRNGKLSYRHRDMAALKLGRPLEPGETVHHKNGDKEDWHPDNLVVFSSQRAHMLFENYRGREATGIIHLLEVNEVLELLGEWMKE